MGWQIEQTRRDCRALPRTVATGKLSTPEKQVTTRGKPPKAQSSIELKTSTLTMKIYRHILSGQATPKKASFTWPAQEHLHRLSLLKHMHANHHSRSRQWQEQRAHTARGPQQTQAPQHHVQQLQNS